MVSGCLILVSVLTNPGLGFPTFIQLISTRKHNKYVSPPEVPVKARELLIRKIFLYLRNLAAHFGIYFDW